MIWVPIVAACFSAGSMILSGLTLHYLRVADRERKRYERACSTRINVVGSPAEAFKAAQQFADLRELRHLG